MYNELELFESSLIFVENKMQLENALIFSRKSSLRMHNSTKYGHVMQILELFFFHDVRLFFLFNYSKKKISL